MTLGANSAIELGPGSGSPSRYLCLVANLIVAAGSSLSEYHSRIADISAWFFVG
jgi:hypothetical protein